MNNTFTAIDFETSQGKRWSICQVGLVRIENGIVKEKFSILVQPPNNYYWDNFSEIHSITPDMTLNSPTFDKVWEAIEPLIQNQNLVAHNAKFDFTCLKQALGYYGIEEPEYTGHCTYRIFKKSLNILCEEFQIPLKHHDALSDALACSELFKIYLKNNEELNGGEK